MPVMISTPRSAAAARASARPSVVSWSVTARVVTPTWRARSTSAAGARRPSDAVVWVCKSSLIMRILSAVARYRQNKNPGLAGNRKGGVYSVSGDRYRRRYTGTREPGRYNVGVLAAPLNHQANGGPLFVGDGDVDERRHTDDVDTVGGQVITGNGDRFNRLVGRARPNRLHLGPAGVADDPGDGAGDGARPRMRGNL